MRGGPSLDPAAARAPPSYRRLPTRARLSTPRSRSPSCSSPPAADLRRRGRPRGHDRAAEWKLLVELPCELVAGRRIPAVEVERAEAAPARSPAGRARRPARAGGAPLPQARLRRSLARPPAYGTIESVERIERRDLRAHHARELGRAARAHRRCAATSTRARVARLIERRLAHWQPGERSRATPRSPARGVRVDAFAAERQQVHLYLGHLGITRNDPDYAALVVMDHVLGTGPGFTNRISRRLRDEQGLAYAVQREHPRVGRDPARDVHRLHRHVARARRPRR